MPGPDPAFPAIFVLTCRISPRDRVRAAMAEAEAVFGSGKARLVDGMIASDPRVDTLFDPLRARLFSKYRMTRGEIATYGTHRLGWKTLLAGNHAHALILEDDFHVLDPARVRHVLAHADDLLDDGRHLLKLFDFPRERRNHFHIRRSVVGIEMAKWRRARAGMVAYLISREGARRLLARDRIFRAVDEDIKYFWELGLDIWSLPDNAIVDASADRGGSLLESDRSNRRRHLLRSLHGMALAAHRNWHLHRAFRRRSAVLAPGEHIRS